MPPQAVNNLPGNMLARLCQGNYTADARVDPGGLSHFKTFCLGSVAQMTKCQTTAGPVFAKAGSYGNLPLHSASHGAMLYVRIPSGFTARSGPRNAV